MNGMQDSVQNQLKKRYNAAVDSFLDKIKGDPNVIAVIVCGSVAYDMVWEKSDIDMTIVIRDQTLKNNSYCIVEDDITINANLVQRSDFKRGMERAIGGSFSQSYYSKGKIVYTTDDSLYEYFEQLKAIGSDDMALSLFYRACELVGIYDKCQKWLTVRKDLAYTQYFVLKAAEVIADMELCLNGEPSSREAIQKALAINPEVITPFYTQAMSHLFTKQQLEECIDKIDRYLESHIDLLKKPVLEFMSDGEIKTTTLISKHFHTQGHFIVSIFEYLTDKGIIDKVSQTIRITPKSKLAVEELGFIYIP